MSSLTTPTRRELSPEEVEDRKERSRERKRRIKEEKDRWAAERQKLFEETKKEVRALYGRFGTFKLDHFPPRRQEFQDTGIEPCRELLYLRNAREMVLEPTASPNASPDVRDISFGRQRVVLDFEKLLLMLNVTAKWSPYDLDIQEVSPGKVHIVARTRAPVREKKQGKP